jgi:hypothetical protein
MTQADSALILRYAMAIYPSMRMTEDQIVQTALIWSNEFANNTKEQVIAGFKEARALSPDWMPSVARIQSEMNKLAVQAEKQKQMKTSEDLFRDSHCGKSPEEWRKYKEWETSSDGAEKIKKYRMRLVELLSNA